MTANARSDIQPTHYVKWHLSFGWWSLLAFATLGLVLEGLHSWKVQWYLGAADDIRRLMWTLAHAHGTLLSLIHLAFAATVGLLPRWNATTRAYASRCLLAAGLMLPLGFFLGGLFTHAGDPGLGVLLVPPGAILLMVGLILTALGVGTLRIC